MSLDHYYALREAGDPAVHHYLRDNFEVLFSEAVGRFSVNGWSAVAGAALVVLLAWGCWLRWRRRLPLPWLWLLPLLIFTPYAFLKSSVVMELIRMAPELPQMWELYFKPWTPLKMVRTPVSALLGVMLAMAAAAFWKPAGGLRRLSRGDKST